MDGLKTYPSLGTEDYLATMTIQVHELAKRQGHDFLAYLLGMAREEAVAVAKGKSTLGPTCVPKEVSRQTVPDNGDTLDRLISIAYEAPPEQDGRAPL